MNILIVGDVFSKLGRESLEINLKKLKNEKKINFIIVNGENISHGRGMNVGHYKWLLSQGVNVITLGNHSYNQSSILQVIDESNVIVRPCNYNYDAPGKGYVTINYNGLKITVFQVLGQVFMNENIISPFEATSNLLNEVESDIFICDFHGEATSEKIAFGYSFAGKVQIIFGTHTHVQTSDARILEEGTAYITDIGMTGPLDGVIGVNKSVVVDRYMKQGQQKFVPQEEGKMQFSAILVEINETTKKVTHIDTLYVIE